MTAAIIEFDSLSDAIRATAQNHDLGPRLGVGFVFVFVRGIQVRRERLEFRGAGIDAFENRSNAVARALQPHGSGSRSPNLRQLFITGSVSLRLAQQFLRSRLHGHCRRSPVHGRQFLYLLDDPGIDLRHLADFCRRQPVVLGGKKPVALLASVELRDTRGFISMTTMRPLSGFTANCTFEPPVSTPTSRIIAAEASRMR